MRKTTVPLIAAAALTVATTVAAQGVNSLPQAAPGVPPPQTTSPDDSATPSQTPAAPPAQTPAETHAAPPVAPPAATVRPSETGAPTPGVGADRALAPRQPVVGGSSAVPVPSPPGAQPVAPGMPSTPVTPAPAAPAAPGAPGGGPVYQIKR
ncbi:MAG: hypothetical protein LWW96_08770 [Acidovorax sp.]|uniref:hypothetical protein n=1 Tax=Acidovorax sp. TaxID=1872122 RepID=UPI0025BFBD32|nr:hypothetical protein [Acidovorax sp.]MCE1192231.1 hypothetical protein [Acidovorax sp.]